MDKEWVARCYWITGLALEVVALKDKNLLHLIVYLGSRGISRIGDFMLLIAMNLAILHSTHSPTAVSVLWIIPALAQLLVSPWAGSFTDRFEKRMTMMVTDSIRAVLIALMALTTNVLGLYVLLFLVNGVGTFFAAASSPYLTKLIPAARRKRVNAINGTLQTSAIVIGPALTGLIVHLTGTIALALWFDSATFLIAVLSLFVLPKLKPASGQSGQAGQPGKAKKDVLTRQGYFAVWRADLSQALEVLVKRPLFTLLFAFVTLVGVLGTATDSQEVVFATKALHLSSVQYSDLVTVAGFGYILGAVFVAILAKKLPLRVLIGTGYVLMSCGFLIYSFSHSFVVAGLGFIILGVFLSLSNAGFSTFYQVSLPPEYMGRVSNITTPAQEALVIVLTIAAGLTASAIGVRDMTIVTSSAMFIIGAIILVTVLTSRARRTFHDIEMETSAG